MAEAAHWRARRGSRGRFPGGPVSFFFPHPQRTSVFSFSLSLNFYFHHLRLLISHRARVILYNIIVISSVRGLRRMAAARKCGGEQI